MQPDGISAKEAIPAMQLAACGRPGYCTALMSSSMPWQNWQAFSACRNKECHPHSAFHERECSHEHALANHNIFSCVQDKKCGMGKKPGFFLNGRPLSRQKKSRVSLLAHFFVLAQSIFSLFFSVLVYNVSGSNGFCGFRYDPPFRQNERCPFFLCFFSVLVYNISA